MGGTMSLDTFSPKDIGEAIFPLRESLIISVRTKDVQEVRQELEADRGRIPEANRHLWVSPALLEVVTGDRNDETKTRLIKLLVANGADVNFGSGQNTPLHIACGYCADPNPRLVRVLLEEDAKSNNSMNSGFEPALNTLCAAVTRFQDEGEGSRFSNDVVECAKLLLEHGARVDRLDSSGNSPLRVACGGGKGRRFPKPQLVQLLLEKGADSNAVFPEDGRTALHLLCAANYENMFLPGCVNEDKRAFFNKCVVECVKSLRVHGAKAHIRDLDENTPITLAKKGKKSELVHILEEKRSII